MATEDDFWNSIVDMSGSHSSDTESANYKIRYKKIDMEWNKGDILRGRNGSDAIHPIVFLDGHDDSYFVGAMITSAQHYPENVPMLEEHFEQIDPRGDHYKVRFRNSYLVEA